MKKIKFENKLSLKKETVARLNEGQLNNLKGGILLFTLSNCGCNTGTRNCASFVCVSAVCGGPSVQTLCPSAQQSVCNGHPCP